LEVPIEATTKELDSTLIGKRLVVYHVNHRADGDGSETIFLMKNNFSIK